MADPASHTVLLFEEFLSFLQANGYRIGIDTHIQLRALLQRIPPATSVKQAKSLLAPLIANSPTEQALFYRLFDQFFARYDRFSPDQKAAPEMVRPFSLPPSPPKKKAPIWLRMLSRRRFYLAIQVILFIFSGYVGILTVDCYRDTHSIPETFLCMRGLLPSIPQQDPFLKNNPAPQDSDDTLISPGDQPSVERRANSGQQISLDETPLLPEDISDLESNWWEKYNPVIKLLLVLVIAGGWFFLELYRVNRRKLFSMQEAQKQDTYYWPIRTETAELELYTEEEFYLASRRLREREPIPSEELDVAASVKETMDAGGYPQLRFRQRSKPPEYLILIQKQSERDHLSMLFDQMTLELSRQDLYVERYFFEQDPRLCWSERYGGEVHLEDLYRRYPDNRVIIIGKPSALFDPVNDSLCDWLSWIRKWKLTAFVSTNNPLSWGRRELELSRQFVLLPATLEALGTVVDILNQDQRPSLRYWLDQNQYPLPPDLEQTELLPALKRYFDISHKGESAQYEQGSGKAQFAHLCACALYPELNWDLSLRMGEALSRRHEVDLLDPPKLLKLVSLNWFREGSIPESVRLALIGAMEVEDRQVVQEVLIEVLKSQQFPKGSYADREHQLMLASQEAQLHNDLEHNVRLIRTAQDYSLNHEIQDPALIEYLDSLPKNVFKFSLPKVANQLLFRQGIPALGPRSVVQAVWALSIGGLILLSVNDAWMKIRTFEGKSYYLTDDTARMRYYTFRGNRFLENQEFDRALASYQQAQQYRADAGEKSYLTAEYNLALLKLLQGEDDLAQADFAMLSEQSASLIEEGETPLPEKERKILATVKSKSEYNQGVIAYRSENLEVAAEAFQRSVQTSNQRPDAVYGQALVLVQKGLATEGADRVNKLMLALKRLQDVQQSDPAFLQSQENLVPLLDSLARQSYPSSVSTPLRALRKDLGLEEAIAVPIPDEFPLIEDETQLASEVTYISDFREGLAVVQFQDKFGFIDQKGNLRGIKYDDARAFSDGLAAVKSGKLWGYVDLGMKEVINPRYENAEDFHQGWASVKQRGQWGMIDKNLRARIPFRYELPFRFESPETVPAGGEALAAVMLNGKYLYLNREAKDVFPNKRFQWAENFEAGGGRFARVQRWGAKYYLNRQGECEASLLKTKTCPTEKWGRQLIREMRGHSGQINAVQMSPNGEYIVSAGSDGRAIVWDKTGKNQLAEIVQSSSIRCLSIGTKSGLIATGGDDGSVQIWKPDGTLIQELAVGKQRIWAVAFSPDQKLIAVGSEDRRAYLLDVQSGAELTRFQQHQQSVTSLSFSPDGRQIASGSDDGKVYFWNQAGKVMSQIEVRTKVLSLAYSPDGTSLLLGTDNGQLMLYDVRSPAHRRLLSISQHGDWVWQVAFSQNGKYFLSASADNTTKVWNLAGELVLDIKQPGTVRSASFSPQGNQLLVASWGTTGSGNNKVSFYQLDIY